MEANCYRTEVVAVMIMVLMVVVQGKTEEVTAAGAPETSLLCVSKCGTCPVECAPPPPPPLVNLVPPSPTLTPPTSSTTHSPPPPSPPTAHASPPPPSGGQRGGLPYPYYYFYTSEATCEHSLSGVLRLLPLVLFFSLSMLLQ